MEQIDPEIRHIFESGVNEIRIQEMLDRKLKAYKEKLINKPQFGDFIKAVKCEMAHHEERYGDESGTIPHHHQMVLSMIVGKLAKAIWDTDKEKFEHHLITIAAVAGTAHKYFNQSEGASHNWFSK